MLVPLQAWAQMKWASTAAQSTNGVMMSPQRASRPVEPVWSYLMGLWSVRRDGRPVIVPCFAFPDPQKVMLRLTVLLRRSALRVLPWWLDFGEAKPAQRRGPNRNRTW